MTENVRKLIGVAIMAVLVVVGVAVSSGDDTNFTRNAAYIKFDGFRQLPEAQQARLAPKFLQQAAPKALDTGPIGKTNNEVGPIFKGAKASIFSTGGANGLSTGKASVLEGRGVDGKGGTSSFSRGLHNNGAISGATGKAGIVGATGINGLSGRKAGIWLQSGGTDGVADRIEKCASSFEEIKVTVAGECYGKAVTCTSGGTVANSLKNVLVTSYIGDVKGESYNCQDLGDGLLPDDTSFPAVINPDSMKPLLLAECMESKVGKVFLKSHIKASAADCVATVMPAISPKRAIQLGTYWQTQQQLICVPPKCSD